MDVDCEGCAGCCIDWRPLTGRAIDHERTGPFDPLDDTYNLVPLTRGEIRRFVERGYGDALRPRLQGLREVFTHNPWGEYGHPDHVLVHRAVAHLAAECGFRVWFSGYVSARSLRLMTQSLAEADGAALTGIELPAPRALCETVCEHYRAAGCWTWRDDWRWPEREALLRFTDTPNPGNGAPLPLAWLAGFEPAVGRTAEECRSGRTDPS